MCCGICHLSCPQCVPARDRKRLKAPPYHLTPAMMEQVLSTLQAEGVTDLQFVHFEGRGDPLANPHLQDLVALARRYFPRTFIGATTHGSYPPRNWLAGSELDLLRVSVDGADAQSYARYRIGGNFDKVMDFMAALQRDRQAAPSRLQVEWKYILFEWNDRDDDIRAAFARSKELGVRLHVCLTHSPGRSRRFASLHALQQALKVLAPQASCDATFQLRTDDEKMIEARAVSAQYATASIGAALALLQQGQEAAAILHLRDALRADPGLDCQCAHAQAGDLLDRHLDEVVAGAASPATLSGLAAICREVGDHRSSTRLLRRYLEIAPDAPDHRHVRQDLRQQQPGIVRALHTLRESLSGVRRSGA